MQKNFTNENFEDFLKQNADQLKLTPSVKAWKGIEKRLNKRRNWTTIIASTFLFTASLFGYLASENTKPLFGLSSLSASDNPDNTTGTASEGIKAKVIPITRNTGTGKDQSNIDLTTKKENPLLGLITPLETRDGAGSNTENVSTAFTKAITESNEQIDLSNKNIVDLKNKPANLLSIENVNEAVKAVGKKHKKTDLEFYFTPTISYRKLSENKSYLRSLPNNSLSFTSYYDVKNVVTHRPHIGLEFGFAVKYPIARAVRLRGGLQFNLNGYEIKAFDNTPEMATISLNNRSGVQSVNTISTYRNFSGGQSDWIKNSYFQVSAPVGIDIKLKGSDKVQLGVATSIQPTYLLGDNAYLISNDYKNYSQVPWLMRRWNVNTSLETFVAYSTGTLKWQIGPQVRYQLLSSFIAKYPVKENLIDFGLKVGVSLNNK